MDFQSVWDNSSRVRVDIAVCRFADPGYLVDGAGGSASSADESQALTVVLHGSVMFLVDL